VILLCNLLVCISLFVLGKGQRKREKDLAGSGYESFDDSQKRAKTCFATHHTRDEQIHVPEPESASASSTRKP